MKKNYFLIMIVLGFCSCQKELSYTSSTNTSQQVDVYVAAIFSFNPSTSVYTKLKDFDGINGQHILLRPNARNYSGGKNSSHQLNHHKPYQYEKLYPTV
jgi:hypothetical protein